MSEQQQLEQLRRMRRIATGLLIAMAVLFVLARWLQPLHSALPFVAAFAEAALVGALADWFAVTALFRKPLGLPIPHTAIIPANKDRIGESIGNFLEQNFMTHDVLREELGDVDFAAIVANWLSDPAQSRAIANEAIALVPMFLHTIEEESVARFMQQAIARSSEQARVAPAAAEILSILIAGNRHQALFDKLLDAADQALENNAPYIRQKVHERSPRWMPKAIDDRVFSRLMDGAHHMLTEMRDENSEWRHRFDRLLDDLIHDLRTSPQYEEKIRAMFSQALAHPLVHDYLNEVWRDIRQRLLADAASPESMMAASLQGMVSNFGNALKEDQRIRDKLNRWVRGVAVEAISGRRRLIAELVTRVIRKWDADTVSRKFELHVGKDLQYIRISGTLVGGMVGLALHSISLLLR